jgi:IS5 family transposase
VARNLKAVEKLLQTPGCGELTKRQLQLLETIRELYAQQNTMHKSKKHSIPDRIVSLSQPWVRPIVRGKAKDKTEFGAKIAISLVNGYTEGTDLIASVKRYKERFGYYPEAVIADKLYRNRANLAYCKKLGIRLSGPPLGRPKASEKKSQLAQEREDARIRNAVEGKFGEGKRCYGLARITARLKETSETVIAIQFLVMNLEHRLRVLSILFCRRLQKAIWEETYA